MIAVLIMNYVWPFGSITFASDKEMLLLEMIVNKAEVTVGEGFIYSIKYTYPSQTKDAINTKITDVLPDELEIIPVDSQVGQGAELKKQINITDDIDSVTRDGNKIIFHFKSPLAAGSTGVIQMKVKFKEGITPPDTVVTNSATITADNAEESAEEVNKNNAVDVTAKVLILAIGLLISNYTCLLI